MAILQSPTHLLDKLIDQNIHCIPNHTPKIKYHLFFNKSSNSQANYLIFQTLLFIKPRNKTLQQMSILSPNSHLLYRELNHRDLQHPQPSNWSNVSSSNLTKTYGFGSDRRKLDQSKKIEKRDCKAASFWDVSRPSFVELEPITDSDHLDIILEQAKLASQPIVIDWMAAWCRKCIFLKPKLEKLAAEFDISVKFYCVDVNKVPQALVKRGNISKMPTIQLWKDGEMKAEVIGGHKAWLVIEEVREMIKNFV